MKDSIPIIQSTNIIAVNHTSNSAVFSAIYTFNNISINDNGTYTCVVSNPIRSDNKTVDVLIGKQDYSTYYYE